MKINKLFSRRLLKVFIIVCITLCNYSCGNKQSNENGRDWDKASSESFCGKEFVSEDYQKEMDMLKKYTTTLNCDGTYTSQLNWNAYSPSGEETYNNTVGISNGNFKNFSGNWEIVTQNIPDYIKSQVSEYEDFEFNHMPKNQTIIIKYQSNTGKKGFAYIYKSNDKNEIILTPIPSESESISSYGEDDLHMYFGRIQD